MVLNRLMRYFIFLAINIIYVQAYLIGEPCKYDEECFVEHSYCEMQQICQCKDNFVETEDRETCIALVGAYCHSKYDCSSLPNSICKDSKCVCDEGFIADHQSSKCMPVATHLESSCISNLGCLPNFGPQSICVNGTCNCTQFYHLGGTYCLQNKGLGYNCANSSECFIGEAYRGSVECRGGQCNCREGYHQRDAKYCIKNRGVNQKTSIGLVLVFIILYFYND